MSKRTPRGRLKGAASIGAVLALVVCVWAGDVGAAGPVAQSAKRKSLTITDTVSLHLVKKQGSVLYERGSASGTLPGSVTARFVTSVTKVTGSVTFHPRGGGTLTINVVGYPTSTGTVAKFSGNLAVRSGTGRFSKALGSGTFSGTVNRRTWAVTVYARARITY
jgi:hypothetical protein